MRFAAHHRLGCWRFRWWRQRRWLGGSRQSDVPHLRHVAQRADEEAAPPLLRVNLPSADGLLRVHSSHRLRVGAPKGRRNRPLPELPACLSRSTPLSVFVGKRPRGQGTARRHNELQVN
eukprot:5001229-Prymnesium_polylepis.2